jgi:type I restriction enzyme, S subunit
VTPTLRFTEFAGAWQPKHGEDAFKSRRQRAKEGLPLYSVTMDQGMVRRDSLDREFASNAPDEANLRVFKDDHVYNMMRMWQGAVGRAPEDCMVSPAYVVLQPEPDTVPAFFDHWFKRRRSIYLLWAYSYGLTSDRLRLYARDFGRVPMALPTFDEQRRIADFLGAVDERIKLLQRRRDALARYKTGMMQRLFDQSLRFTRDDGTAFPDWEEKRVGELGKTISGLTGKTADDFGEGQPYVTYKQIFGASKIDLSECLRVVIGANENQNLLARGDVLFTTSSETPNEVGFASILLDEVQELYLNSFCFALRPHSTEALVPQFARYLFRSPDYRRKVFPLAQGSTRYNLAKTSFLKLRLGVPHPDEQRKIADALSALDDKIAAVSDQVKHMQTFKKGLLQQVFV